jgi:hypothetical protein
VPMWGQPPSAVRGRSSAVCALKVGAGRLYTWNMRHFQLLGMEIQKVATMPPAV